VFKKQCIAEPDEKTSVTWFLPFTYFSFSSFWTPCPFSLLKTFKNSIRINIDGDFVLIIFAMYECMHCFTRFSNPLGDVCEQKAIMNFIGKMDCITSPN
jgi:hypothetical protein